MSKFLIKRRFSLSFLGKEWKECFIRFKSLSIGEMRGILNKDLSKQDPSKIIDTSVNLIKGQFVDGTAISNEGKVIKLSKDDIEDLPAEVIQKTILFLVGEFGQGI